MILFILFPSQLVVSWAGILEFLLTKVQYIPGHARPVMQLNTVGRMNILTENV
jgi:hypothetical protein